MNVSEATLEDRSGWENLYQQYADFYQMPMDEGILNTVWDWIHSEQEAFYCLVARDDNLEAIGFMHYRAMHSPLRGSKVGFLDDLFVNPDHRGTGVVEELFEALDAEAKERNWPFVRWITADDNLRAQSVYNKLSERTSWVTYQLNAGKLA